MERRERGFFGKVLVLILTLFAVIGLVAMTISVLCPYIDPKQFVWAAFFGLAFWEILFFNVLVFFLLLLLWSRKVWIAVLALLIAIPGVMKSYSFGNGVEKGERDSIRLMSYNVYQFQSLDGKNAKEDVASQMIRVIREQSPDILCCQEFSYFKQGVGRPKCITMFADSIGMPYVYYNRNDNYGGNVIFSKYPVVKVMEGDGFSKEKLYGVLVSVDAGEKGQFYLAGIHLVSNMITRDEIDKLINASDYQQNLDTVGRSVAHKLKGGYTLRSDQVKEMLQGIPEVDAPIILCGDFNDTPLSYTYRRMQKAGYKDTFISVGRGIKPTYAGKLPLLRIDYIWANDKVTPLNFTRCHSKASDHYPILLDFTVEKTNTPKPVLQPTENTVTEQTIKTEII